MKYFFFTIIFFSLFACEIPETKNEQTENVQVIKTVKLKTKQDTIDYSLGVLIGKQMEEYGIYTFDKDILLKAINDVIEEKAQELPIHPDVAKQIVSLYVQQKLNEKVVYELEATGKFMKENSTKEGIITLDNGIQYKKITEGAGEIPQKTDNVTIHYSGELIDGNRFVSTYNGSPVSFDISTSMEGWQEILPKMSEGAEWVVYLPPEYAFGAKGNKNVPPNSIVIYHLKLLSVN